LDKLPVMVRLMVNEAMQIKCENYPQTKPYECNEERQGHAKGYKPKIVKTRAVEVTSPEEHTSCEIPQVLVGGVYREALEKGLRIERALLLALAELYVQGLSMRKEAAIT
jgi:putative transposase